jgi:hypothetical protein
VERKELLEPFVALEVRGERTTFQVHARGLQGGAGSSELAPYLETMVDEVVAALTLQLDVPAHVDEAATLTHAARAYSRATG